MKRSWRNTILGMTLSAVAMTAWGAPCTERQLQRWTEIGVDNAPDMLSHVHHYQNPKGTRICEGSVHGGTWLESMKDVAPRSSASIFMTGGVLGVEEGLASRAFEGLSLTARDVSLQSESVNRDQQQIGVGALLDVSDHLSLGIGLLYGSGTVRQDLTSQSFDSLLTAEAKFRFLAGNLTGRLYPFESQRLQPWLSAGIKGAILKPQRGSVQTSEGRIVFADLDLKSAGTVDFTTGAGFDVPITRKLKLTVGGEYGPKTGWSAGIGIVVPLNTKRVSEEGAKIPQVSKGLVVLQAGDRQIQATYGSPFGDLHFNLQDQDGLITSSVINDRGELITHLAMPSGQRVLSQEQLSSAREAAIDALLARPSSVELLSQRRPELLATLVLFAQELSSVLPAGTPPEFEQIIRLQPSILGIGYEKVVLKDSKPPSMIKYYSDATCAGACGPGCGWCVGNNAFGHICYTNGFCQWHDAHCGAFEDFFNCDWTLLSQNAEVPSPEACPATPSDHGR